VVPFQTDYYRRLRTLSFKKCRIDHFRPDAARTSPTTGTRADMERLVSLLPEAQAHIEFVQGNSWHARITKGSGGRADWRWISSCLSFALRLFPRAGTSHPKPTLVNGPYKRKSARPRLPPQALVNPASGRTASSVVLSIIIPVYNEQGNILLLRDKLDEALRALDVDHEIIFVDDGKHRLNETLLTSIAASDSRYKVIVFRAILAKRRR
jgi:hypothetical protein